MLFNCRNFPNDQPDFPNMLILKKLGGGRNTSLATALISRTTTIIDEDYRGYTWCNVT
jgi:hypothetical protein